MVDDRTIKRGKRPAQGMPVVDRALRLLDCFDADIAISR